MIYDKKTDTTAERVNTLRFYGDGADYFRILLMNLLLTLVTLGLYYPWAKAARRRYLWNETEVNGSRLTFNGTGREMFRGFIILYVIVVTLYLSGILIQTGMISIYVVGLLYLLFIAALPLSIIGSFRYRVTRTSWRGVFLGFDGKVGEFYGIFFGHSLLVIITLGLYLPWFYVRIMKYLISHVKMGDIQLRFAGDGMDLFFVNLVGSILSAITFYLYIPIFMKERYEYFVNNVSITDRDQQASLFARIDNATAWKTIFLNGLLTFITLGIYGAWYLMEVNRMWINNIQVPSNIDLDRIEQTQLEAGGSIADQLIDGFDLDIGF